jgi:hypothetical protein
MILRNVCPRMTSTILVAMPSAARTHIQNTAPGPPMAMEVQTPAMLPFPTTVAREAVSAWKGEMSPSREVPVSPVLLRPKSRRNWNPIRLRCMKRRRRERKSPAPSRRMTVWGPHTMFARNRMDLSISSIFYPLRL